MPRVALFALWATVGAVGCAEGPGNPASDGRVDSQASALADDPAPGSGKGDAPLLLKPARVFDGIAAEPHKDWVVLVKGEQVRAAGPADEVKAPKDVRVIELPNMTLLPG